MECYSIQANQTDWMTRMSISSCWEFHGVELSYSHINQMTFWAGLRPLRHCLALAGLPLISAHPCTVCTYMRTFWIKICDVVAGFAGRDSPNCITFVLSEMWSLKPQARDTLTGQWLLVTRPRGAIINLTTYIVFGHFHIAAARFKIVVWWYNWEYSV